MMERESEGGGREREIEIQILGDAVLLALKKRGRDLEVRNVGGL